MCIFASLAPNPLSPRTHNTQKHKQEGEFSIPKRDRSSAAAADDFAIPRRDPSSSFLHASHSSDSLGLGAGYDQHEQPPPPPPPGSHYDDDGNANEPFPVVPGFSLDRARFDPAYLIWGMRGAGVDARGLRGWDSREAEAPLVLPLPDFGCVVRVSPSTFLNIFIYTRTRTESHLPPTPQHKPPTRPPGSRRTGSSARC